MPVTPVWRAYPAGDDVQLVALPVVLTFKAGFGTKFRRKATDQLPSPLVSVWFIALAQRQHQLSVTVIVKIH
jgi:hypothetical protein